MSRQIQDLDPIDSTELEIADLVPVEDVSEPRTKKATLQELAQKLADIQMPIGSLYFNAEDGNNPSHPSLLGFGTWEPYAKGRVPVGVSDTDSEFAGPGQTGGSKTVTLTSAQMPVHNHGVNDPGHSHNVPWNGSNSEVVTNARDIEWSNPVDYMGRQTDTAWTGISTQNAGGGQAHNNLQPYIAVYIWKRVG